MDREIYLDNSATTKPYPEVIESMVEMLDDNYGNPSSLHKKGIQAEKAVKTARDIIAKTLDVKSNEIYFTSGGTEANNIAIRGYAKANSKKGNHLITSKIEHPSVLNTFEFLEREGYRVSYINVDSNGVVDIEQLKKEICEDTIFISVMHVNNEVGSVAPIQEIRRLMDLKQSQAILHVDAIQSFGKLLFTPERFGIDLLSISAHKLHGPKGVGALYIKKGIPIEPIMFGGSQELNMRSGTENVPGILGFGKAVEITFASIENHLLKINKLKEKLREEIEKSIDDVVINGQVEGKNAPHILNVSFKGLKSEVLLHALEAKGIYVSSGSACSSNKPAPSHVLTAMGVDKHCIEGAIRFSFSAANTEVEISDCVQELATIVKQLRRFRRR